jgi:hypothetical protein
VASDDRRKSPADRSVEEAADSRGSKYERDRPGELMHLDPKKLARIEASEGSEDWAERLGC